MRALVNVTDITDKKSLATKKKPSTGERREEGSPEVCNMTCAGA